LEKVLIPELLFAQGALDRGLLKDETVRMRRRDLLKSALLGHLRQKFAKPEEIPAVAVANYYRANIDRYRTPARYAIWRILVATRKQAEDILAQAKKEPTPKKWGELARQYSLDKSTHMRGGNLGFVTEDGVSTNKKVRVDKALVDAAKGVRDGEFVPTPVSEGSGFAVVWRRGSMPAVNRTLEDEQATIRKILAREQGRAKQKELLDNLRDKYVGNVSDKALNLITVTSTGSLTAQAKPGRLKRRAGRGAPTHTPRGLR
jgi:peptidyl-prolyl cis-trans isomerase C